MCRTLPWQSPRIVIATRQQWIAARDHVQGTEMEGMLKEPRNAAAERTERAIDTPYRRIDHIALAVADLEQAIALFQTVMGFTLVRRRHVQGRRTGMLSAEMEANGIRFVLCQGTEPDSQISRLIDAFGVGLAHVAFEVDDVDDTVRALRDRGLAFDTDVIHGPGLTQAFSSRCGNTGMSFELINRQGEEGFLDDNIQALFDQLERNGKY